MAPNVLRMLRFAIEYPGWHSCGPDSVRALASLERRQLVQVKRYPKAQPQFRLWLGHSALQKLDAFPAMVAAVKHCLDCERRRRDDLLPGAPASQYTKVRIEELEAALKLAEG